MASDTAVRIGSDNPTRIGYVLKRYPRYSETFVVNEILAHEAAGLEIEIFALRPPCDSHFQSIIARVRAPVHYLPTAGLKAVGFWHALEKAGEVFPNIWPALGAARGHDVGEVHQAVRLARKAREKGIRHLHAHFATSATSVARLAAGFAGLPYTFTAHAKDIFHEEVRPEDLRRKLSDAAGVVTVSDYNLNHLRGRYGPAAARVQRIYNGLDLGVFPFTAPEVRAPEIVSVGRLVEKKGFAHLIDACAILAARGRPFACRIIGTGDLEAELRAQIARLGLDGRVQLTGPRPQEDVIEHVTNAAVFAAPCVIGSDNNRDGLPTVLLESMALGTPCVSTDVTGIPEVLHHDETGLMVAQRDPSALADAIERLLSDPGERVRLASRARRLIETEFDIHRNAARMRRLFLAAPRAEDEPARRVG
jgi:glycosyltransferase involved in cell wall biosynthesis